ncbi:hypothetical protein BY996DRAFT_8449319 [Phakopsora pachyrhizi]|nr:hypothetical protein BY996DRAFT_8449319 [Phakopsora pachyrhizi]
MSNIQHGPKSRWMSFAFNLTEMERDKDCVETATQANEDDQKTVCHGHGYQTNSNRPQGGRQEAKHEVSSLRPMLLPGHLQAITQSGLSSRDFGRKELRLQTDALPAVTVLHRFSLSIPSRWIYDSKLVLPKSYNSSKATGKGQSTEDTLGLRQVKPDGGIGQEGSEPSKAINGSGEILRLLMKGMDVANGGWSTIQGQYKEGFKGLEQDKDSTRITGQKSRGYRIK